MSIAQHRRTRRISLLARAGRGGAVQMLTLVLVALLLVFGPLLGGQLFNAGALHRSRSSCPKLGILSLAMMVALLSGGLNLSIVATANLCALTMAWCSPPMCRDHRVSCGSPGR